MPGDAGRRGPATPASATRRRCRHAHAASYLRCFRDAPRAAALASVDAQRSGALVRAASNAPYDKSYEKEEEKDCKHNVPRLQRSRLRDGIESNRTAVLHPGTRHLILRHPGQPEPADGLTPRLFSDSGDTPMSNARLERCFGTTWL
jgi:hypothetical protein